MSTISEPVARDEAEAETGPDGYDLPQDSLEVHRDGPLSLIVGGSAGIVAVAFLLRGVGAGSALDWALFALTGAVAVMHLAALVDARAPLLVLDRLGVRVRRGPLWQGVAWSDVDHLEHRARATTLRDGSLTVVTTDGRRLGVRLSLSTRLVGADWHEVDDALDELTAGTVPIRSREDLAEVDTVSDDVVDDDVVGRSEAIEEPLIDEVADVTDEPHELDEADTSVTEVFALRESRPARRGEVLLHPEPVAEETDQSADQTGDEAQVGDRAASYAGETQTIVIDAFALDETPAPVEPVVGRELAQARQRVGVSVEALAERTRIRPHVIEAIERDDFDSCGGDFYARGHLRTLARVLGVDATQLLALYDERNAHAPIDARRVFEAELASAPRNAHGSRGSLNWSVLVAAVMAVVLVWSVARLVMDGPVPLADQPVLNGSPGGKATLSGATTKVSVTLTAATGGAGVIVRDARQQIVLDADLAFMQTAEVSVAPPVRISTTDGGVVVTVDGVEEGAIGATGQDAQRTYVP